MWEATEKMEPSGLLFGWLNITDETTHFQLLSVFHFISTDDIKAGVNEAVVTVTLAL